MKPNQTQATLYRLFALVTRSLPAYLRWATPHRRTGDERIWETIHQIVADQESLSLRVAELIADRGFRLQQGEFPITFTSTHDLQLDFLARRLVDWQRNTVTALEECSRQLAHDPEAQALADETLGSARGHLESLEELTAVKLKVV